MHIWQWMDYTPQFQLMIVLISSPLSLMARFPFFAGLQFNP
jgi:hypothetical protein